ncbi:hypothetical protein [Bacillus gobiensis]|uniref:hypothetical protein n=1 Tax=Bacillus gobiensis TaxID=1441095 RepID=UPI003D22D883
MKFSLLANGADSLKGAFSCLEKISELQEGADHNLKDTVIYLNHGLEILFKLILKSASPALMFSDIKSYQKAKEDMKKKGAKNVFEINPSLHTITLEEALKRVEFLCDIEIPDSLKATIYYINKIRNQLMHYEIELNESELDELVEKLKYCYEESVNFLVIHINNLEEKIDEARFEYTREDYETDMGEWYAEMRMEDARLEYIEEGYEDLGEGKW